MAFIGKVALSSHVAHPSHKFVSFLFHVKFFNLTGTGAIAQPSLLSPVTSFICTQECSMCLLRLDISVPFNFLQLEIQIKLISHVFSASQRYMHYHKNIHTCLLDKCSRILSMHTPVSVSSLLLRVLKEFLPKFRPWQDNNKEIATRLTLTRAMAPLTCEFHNRIDMSNYHL